MHVLNSDIDDTDVFLLMIHGCLPFQLLNETLRSVHPLQIQKAQVYGHMKEIGRKTLKKRKIYDRGHYGHTIAKSRFGQGSDIWSHDDLPI